MDNANAEAFEKLTGHAPLRWQRRLFACFRAGNIPPTCDLPTGLGKTSVIALWLLALAWAGNGPRLPRRLVYVVNRRTVVDQASDEAKNLADKLRSESALTPIAKALAGMGVNPDGDPLAVSTLRGQKADNGLWRNDPARPAVVVGTPDLIGSGLLFSAYRAGFKSRPAHAGYLGHDALIVHDEAHLSPALQRLLKAIHDEQQSRDEKLGRPLRVMELTATPRQADAAFGLAAEDFEDAVVRERLRAGKRLVVHHQASPKGGAVAKKLFEIAWEYRASGEAVLIFARTVKDVNEVVQLLVAKKQQAQPLTGTMRGYERDQFAEATDKVFARFRPEPPSEAPKGTVYLVATSAGEVGINISADHLVCDLSTYESMAQRLGRVNRFGRGAARVDVVSDLGDVAADEPPIQQARRRTLALLEKLPKGQDGRRDASPAALRDLDRAEKEAAFSPQPPVLETTDILFDAWSLTSVREELPVRPAVAEYIHGLEDPSLPETSLAWRKEVELLDLPDERLGEVLDDYPLKPHELLRDQSYRVREALIKLAQHHGGQPAWLVRQRGKLKVVTLSQLVDGESRDIEGRIHYATIILPPCVGGLTKNGILDGTTSKADGPELDVADKWADAGGPLRRRGFHDGLRSLVPPDGMRLVRAEPFRPTASDNGDEPPDADDAAPGWRAFFVRRGTDDGGISRYSTKKQDLVRHLELAADHAEKIGRGVGLGGDLLSALVLAAKWHDLGKRRRVWQISIGNHNYPAEVWAKSGGSGFTGALTGYRHEFGSLTELERSRPAELDDHVQRDIVLHLIAAHHGRGRPHFPADEAFDPECADEVSARVAAEVPRRYARLQRKYGRWGLAWLESLLRSADALASEEAQ